MVKSKNNLVRKIGLISGPLFFIILSNLNFFDFNNSAIIVFSLAVWMLIWWVTESISISVTALLPLVIFPIFDVMDMNSVGANYGSSIVFLFFGGFVLALGLEKVNLHKRIALYIISKVGGTPNRIIMGFMISTAFLSMWITNTASTVVMLPIAISVIKLLIDKNEFNRDDNNFALSVMLGIAFSANAGGIATIIGTPPNSVLIGLLENEFNIKITFLKWMVIGLPFTILLLSIIYFVLTRIFFTNKNLSIDASKSIIKLKLDELGTLNSREKHVLKIFCFTVFLWIFRGLINSIFPNFILTDSIISVSAAIALFAIPINFNSQDFVLKWKDTKNLSWGILLLFGGGLSLAKAMSETGIILSVTEFITNTNLSVFIIVLMLICLMLFMTELMSNVALVAVLAPVVAGVAIGLDIPILHLLIPVTIASSCAFMLPMATPPNAIVFASGYIKIYDMVRVGILINFLSILLLIIFYKFFIPIIFK